MSENDAEYFKLRKEGKIYLSKVFTHGAVNEQRRRFAHAVFEGTERAVLGEVEGALCLRLTGDQRKTQVTALISQDDAAIRRITLQTFKSRAGGWYEGYEKEAFTFRADEFERLLEFLRRLKFIDLSNEERFQIEDLSEAAGPKIITDATDRALIGKIKKLDANERERLFRSLHDNLTQEEINLLLGRRQALEQFDAQLALGAWSEANWQDFFEAQNWVFGYGLDYRIMRQFDREMVVGAGGTDNREKPTVDFLMNFTDYTVLVEIKRPDTPIFQPQKSARAGTWRFSADFMDAISQVLEQKAEWLNAAQSGEHFNKAGTSRLEARTRDAKTILVIGNRAEFGRSGNVRETNIKRDTFELFRRDTRSIEIVTFDELLERANFIIKE
ncbi:Shedu immune nuclease family protein [Mesorhizobium sp. WSM2239]|uniref:Shedu immune nuclease family protein n=2 Tax=unclassified Mesorhizobium TaxID=325217 RepID=A0AAU8D605_9HYPH